MIAKDATIGDRVREQREAARALARLERATPGLRALRDTHGWDVAIAAMLRDFPGIRAADAAAAFGVAHESMCRAFTRTGFAETERMRWSLVQNDALAATLAAYERDIAEREAAARDRNLVAPWRRVNGNIKTVKYGDAMRALFADGRVRSSREVALVLRGDVADSNDVAATRTCLGHCEEVEPAGDDLWRRVPTRRELRARVAELEAELARVGAKP